jgi:hypothetical protein
MDEQMGADPTTSAAALPPVPDRRTPSDRLRITFRRLADTWRDKTDGLSSPSQIAAHPAYRRVIEMDEPSLPFIFEELQERGGQWYVALRAITGASPVPPEAAGRARRTGALAAVGTRTRLLRGELRNRRPCRAGF